MGGMDIWVLSYLQMEQTVSTSSWWEKIREVNRKKNMQKHLRNQNNNS